MNLALQRRRFFIAMAVTAAALIVALVALAAMLGFHAAWAGWLFGAAILAGFASHGWLMLGLARDKAAP
ncbi:MAG TPA: hypothetical protein VMT68_12755 [Caulobacteraceae bacterium]|nr:hypothetical protein [Caulobacteraceae bacterium]